MQRRPAEPDLYALLKALRGVGDPLQAGLRESWSDPEGFTQRLLSHVSRQSEVAAKSVPGAGVDLYHDLVVRHLRTGRDALIHGSGGSFKRVAYDDLHARVTALCGTWEDAGVAEGQSLTLVLPIDADYAVALLAGLRLGLVVSCLPPHGRAFVRRRLEALAPDHLASHARYGSLLGEWSAKQLTLLPDPEVSSIPALRSATYAPGSPALRLFSPLSPEPLVPRERSADVLFLSLLRDAVVTIGLEPGERFALPGFDPLQFQPWALLTSLFAGACFVSAEERDLTDPERLSTLGLRVVGITRAVRDALLAMPELPAFRLWLRNPTEPFHWDRWSRFATRMSTGRPCRGMNLVANASFPGAMLASPQLPDPQLHALPVAGEPWMLADLNEGGAPSLGSSGLYQSTREEVGVEDCGRFLIAGGAATYRLSGSLDLLADGQVFPREEVEEILSEHPGVLGAVVTQTAAGGEELNRTATVAVVFMDPLAGPGAIGELQMALEERLALELGPRGVPTLFRFYPLVPRKTEGALDAAWCHWQFVGGTLDRKQREPIFRHAARLRRLVDLSRPENAGES